MEEIKTDSTNSNPVKTESEGALEKAAEELQIKVPQSHEPLGIRIIALFILVGGLSLLGSVFVDIFSDNLSLSKYLLRLITGAAAVLISYGLIKGLMWSLWFYAVIVIISFFTNITTSFFLVFILLYLIYHRKYFEKSAFDLYVINIFKGN